MCYNEYVSIATFLTTTIINYILLKSFKGNKQIISIVIIWQWVILMQFFEAIIWISKYKKNSLNTIGTYGAYIANILQPLIVYLSIILLTNQRKEYKLIFGVLVFSYIVYCIQRYISKIKKNIKYLTNKDNCSNIYYVWWKDMNYGSIYVILLVLLFIFAQPHSIYIPQLLYILIILLISIHTNRSCSNASIWCLMATAAPLFTLIYHKYIHNI